MVRNKSSNAIENDNKYAANSISNPDSPLNRQISYNTAEELAKIKQYRTETLEVELEKSFKPIDENPERYDIEMSQTSSKHTSKNSFIVF